MNPAKIVSIRSAGYLVALAAIIVIPLLLPSYPLYIINFIVVFAIAGMGLNILMGMTGMISIGHAALLGIGAYTSALLTMRAGVPILVSIPAAGIVTALTGLLLGIPSLRMGGFYFAIVTMIFGVAVEKAIKLAKGFTEGAKGLWVPPAEIAGFQFNTDHRFYFLVMSVLVLCALMAWRITKSRSGRAWLAMRESEVAAQCMGINIVRYKLLVFVVSAFITGIAGALFAHLTGYICALAFSTWISIMLVGLVVIGGMGSVIGGSIVGSVVIFGVPEILGGTGPVTNLIYGIVMILAMIFYPRGVVGGVRLLGAKVASFTGRIRPNTRDEGPSIN